MHVVLDHIDEAAKGIRTFWFKPEQPLRYQAGQFTELILPHDNPDSRGIKRWFTLSSSPTEPLISITTKFAPENRSSFKSTLYELKPGSQIQAASPMGDFVLPRDNTKRLVFVAGGIGVTPMRSMIKYLTDTKEKRDITLIYAANSLEEVVFKSDFEAANIKAIYVLKQPAADWKGESGTIDGSKILQLAPPTDNTLYYLSGPEPMVESFYDQLKKLDINKRNLVTDYFPGYTGI